LSRTGVVYELGPRGGSTVLARFDDISRLQLDQAGPDVGPTPTPTATLAPPTSSVPTATLEGTWIRVNVNTLNVRVGPGPNYDKIGELSRDEQIRVLGAVADYTWLAIDFQGGVGWVATEFVEVLGTLVGVNIVQAPPTPTLAATPLPATPDLIIDTVVLDQAQPIPGRAFTATISVRNAGATAVGRFAVAATWEPGGVFTSGFVEGLAGGQSAQTTLTATVTGTGIFQVGVVADLNGEITESNEGNNVYNITYRVDYPLFANQTNFQVGVDTFLDLYGGSNEFKWDGYNIDLEPGASVGILSGVSYENVHYGLLDPGVINNTVGLTTDQVLAGTVIGIYTVEGKRGVIRIDNRVDTTIWISYRVYNNTP
ncbi:MAG: SH3 domain-containing protein, partial [Chloroflexi bacterium]|nr:SH3 domain-containing protein [Chloroflexota bacterium]